MKAHILILLLFWVVVPSLSQGQEGGVESRINYTEIPAWILERIEFPQEALHARITAEVTFTLVVSTTGQSAVTKISNSPHPAFDREIERVVAMAPLCLPREKDGVPTTASRTMQIDFSQYLPKEAAENMLAVKNFTPPLLLFGKPNIEEWKQPFIQWLYDHVTLPKALAKEANYIDTVRINYTVGRTGLITQFAVTECRNLALQSALEATIANAPRWMPAKADDEPVDFPVSDRMIISAERGKKDAFMKIIRPEEYFDNKGAEGVYALSTVEQAPHFRKGDGSKFAAWFFSQISVSKPPNEVLTLSFIVEKDGTVSHLDIKKAPNQALYLEAVRIMQNVPLWSPGMNKGEPVRVQMSFNLHFTNKTTYIVL